MYVDNSPVLHEPSQSRFEEQLGQRHLPYTLDGGGDIERYASTMSQHAGAPSSPAAVKADVVHTSLAAAVLADLRQDYDKCVAWQRHASPSRRLNPGPPDMPVVRSFEQIVALLHWTPDVLRELDDLHDEATARLAEDTGPLIHAREVALRQELARGEVLALF